MIGLLRRFLCKLSKPVVKIPLEEQIERLKEIGFVLNEVLDIDYLLSEFDRRTYEENPYRLLLSVMGGEHETDVGKWVPNSNDMYNFDTECIEDDGDYTVVLNNMKRISRGIFNIETVKDFVDIEADKASISFSYNGKKHIWSLKVNDDWFDVDLIERINNLLRNNGESRQFYSYSPDQTIILSCVDTGTRDKIEQLTGEKFI